MHGESFFSDPRSWIAVAFVIFFVLFGGKIWAALASLLDKRAAAIRAELAEAQRLRSEAEALLRDASARRDEAVAEAKALLEGAKAEAARLAVAAEAEAKSAANRRERMALDRITAAEKAALDEVRRAAADVASTAAEAVIREEVTVDADAKLVDRAIAGLPTALGRRAA
ncbi:ATP synthase subunit b 2 [Rhodovastum atsumiense]|uniref:ATP synthase subunit b n=1 Tax=Rhodovastum atsumiense TaxID=504468 RepID=A0A5M6IZC8_9PROT|nr:F0F1 ATP synthase subunit B [Rhodovastum atsumiense]KAA5613692.1 F0F1 ATP synthase subunit B [Rhodovastum atsumiense]CAH2599610.1 ATP synthase subunit b 2 [Rhodovastum atsumiense]